MEYSQEINLPSLPSLPSLSSELPLRPPAHHEMLIVMQQVVACNRSNYITDNYRIQTVNRIYHRYRPIEVI